MSRSGSFYFGMKIGHGHDVWMATMDFNTGQVVNAPVRAADHNLGSNRMADWSPDGKHLAYVTRATAYTKKDVVSVRSIETGKIRELHPKLDYIVWPQWAPDGKSLLISGTDRKGRRGLHIVDAETSETKLVVSGDNVNAEWSHDGKSVFHVSDDELVELNLASGTKQTLLRRRIVGLISVSPSGRELACISMNRDTKKLSLTVVPLSGGTPREIHQLTGGVEGNAGTAWSPDGASILFNQGPNDVLMIPAAGGSAKLLNLGISRPRGIRVQPAGDKLTFYTGGGLGLDEVWTMENFLPILDKK
jgi:Tol biopolymer transport system component